MKTLHKLILILVALAGLTMATPAQAYWHHYRSHVVYVNPGYGYYDPYYSPYYGGGYYSGYYGRPYYDRPYYGGSHFTFSFGGHSSSRRGSFRR